MFEWPKRDKDGWHVKHCEHGLELNKGCMECHMEKAKRRKANQRIKQKADKLNW